MAWATSSPTSQPGLHVQWQRRITDQFAGAPFPSAIPVSIWALAFSPNGKYLAFGAGFVERDLTQAAEGAQGKTLKEDEVPFKSYVLVTSADDPARLVRKFEIPIPPWVSLQPLLVWDATERFVAVDFGRSHLFSEKAFLLDVETGAQTAVAHVGCSLVGVLTGPLLVMNCRDFKSPTHIRFEKADGTIQDDWAFPDGSTEAIELSPGGDMIAIGSTGQATLATSHFNEFPHEIIVFRLSDHNELRRWPLPPSQSYGGRFADNGKTFCTLFWGNAREPQGLECYDIATSDAIRKIPVQFGGWQDFMVTGGTLIALNDPHILFIPSWALLAV